MWSFPGHMIQEWVRQLESRTGGRVKVKVHPGGSLLTARESFSGVKNRIADMSLGLPMYNPGRFPALSVFGLPFDFPDAVVSSLVLWDFIQQYEPESLQDFKILTAFTTEPHRLMTTEPVTDLDQLENRRVRAIGSAVPTIKALGASPAAIPMPEVAQSLQKGIVTGIATSREVLKDFKLAEYVNHVTDYKTGGGRSFPL